MTVRDPSMPPLEEPQAELERQLINEFLHAAGHNPAAVRARTDEEARNLLARASAYAAGRLTEVESRSHYVKSLRGQP
ncbi:MAG: hypothetical protein OEW19_22070 [Acidobacteriota bacterium]|nr:hypothetical protein [Acidobacteriota bacterium]